MVSTPLSQKALLHLAAHNLLEFALSGQVDALEKAWQASLDSPADIAVYCQTIEALCNRDMAAKVLHLANALIDVLEKGGRPGDAATVATTVVRMGAHNESLTKRLFALLEAAHGQEDWYPVVKELAQLREDNLSPKVFEAFDAIRRYTKGNVLYHRSGWGEGVVEEFRALTRELVVNFVTGRRTLPLQSALDSLVPLASDDLRAMRLVAMDQLHKLAEEQPAVLIRKAAKVYRGRISSGELKEMLSPSVLPTSRWASWWKKAKAAAESDPWLQVEGNATRPTFVLRKNPVSFADEARAAIRRGNDLGGELAVLLSYLQRAPDEAARVSVLDLVAERVEGAVKSADPKKNHAHILDGLLMLEERGRQGAVPAAQELRNLLVDAAGEFHPEHLERLATQGSREHAIQLLEAALGENWVDRCVSALPRFPSNVLEPLVALLQGKGHAERMLRIWNEVAPYPRRFPTLTYLLGKLYAEGAFAKAEHAPDEISAARVMLHLVRVLSAERKGNVEKGRLVARLITLLAGRKSFVAKVLETVDKENMAAYLGICERGGEDFPQEISDMVLRAVAKRFPELTAVAEKPFWDTDRIFVTQEGLRRRREEYRRLVDEKIPENSKAIGNAAALGDLSENSEWESAMEEQRNLTTRAAMMDQELRKARLLEDQQVPDGIVAPGTRFTVTNLLDGTSHEYRMLGPWDMTDDHVINYLAPMGRALLGRSIGEVVNLEGPRGPQEVRIERIEKLTRTQIPTG